MIKNSKLQNLFKLSSKVTLIIPSTTDINKETDNVKQVDEALTLLSNCFGGATQTETYGCWNSPSVGLVKEKSTTIFAYCKESDLQQNIDIIVEFCEKLKNDMKQDAIALEINGEMYFI